MLDWSVLEANAHGGQYGSPHEQGPSIPFLIILLIIYIYILYGSHVCMAIKTNLKSTTILISLVEYYPFFLVTFLTSPNITQYPSMLPHTSLFSSQRKMKAFVYLINFHHHFVNNCKHMAVGINCNFKFSLKMALSNYQTLYKCYNFYHDLDLRAQY